MNEFYSSAFSYSSFIPVQLQSWRELRKNVSGGTPSLREVGRNFTNCQEKEIIIRKHYPFLNKNRITPLKTTYLDFSVHSGIVILFKLSNVKN